MKKMASGKRTIFYRNVPVWYMSYQGKISDNLDGEEVDSVYSFLKSSLRKAERKTPFRGPARFSERDFEHIFEFKGDYSYFVGRESVKEGGAEVFFRDIMGSLIK